MRKPKLFSLVSTTNVIYIFFNLKNVAPVRLDENDGFFSIFACRGLNLLNVQLP